MFNSFPQDIPDRLSNLSELLCYRAEHQPDKTAYIFLKDGETEETKLTYQELDRQARAIAVHLKSIGSANERALLVFPPGLEYITAFFGCLYAGVTAVPVYPPHPARPERTLPRLTAIVKDARPYVALTLSSLLPPIQPVISKYTDFENMHWATTDTIPGDLASDWQEPVLNENSLAFLQYTSGSTGVPKGVMVTHGNLLHNSALIRECFGNSKDSRGVIWLPPYHDMGLIGGILQPLYAGFPVTLMSPIAFLQKPVRWLQAVSRYKATVSGGPDFAYNLCVRRITPGQCADIDLSSWDVAFNGAEPVREKTLDRFSAAFESCGFRKSAFYPCYGLAEATLIVSGGIKEEPPVLERIQTDALEQNHITPANKGDKASHVIIGCGKTLNDQQIRIVNPDTLEGCDPDSVGEIWVSGRSVAQGYWHHPGKTKEIFEANIGDSGEGPFLRTGDLGFLKEGELFVTGRLKDLIIIRGRNYYPEDIEQTVEQSCPVVRPGCNAVFRVEVDGEERVIVAAEIERRRGERRRKSDRAEHRRAERRAQSDRRQEKILPEFKPDVRRPPDNDTAIYAIRKAVTEQHELEVYGVLLLKPGSIPKTSSGKIQRHACRAGFFNGSLNVVKESIVEEIDVSANEVFPDREKLLEIPPEQRQSTVESYLQVLVSNAFRDVLNGKKVGLHDNFFELGGHSLLLIRLQNKLEETFSRNIPIVNLFSYPTITALAGYLTHEEDVEHTAFRKIRERVRKQKEAVRQGYPIAIIGMAGRFPGAGNIDEFWQNLCDGKESVSFFTDEELRAWGVDPDLLNNPSYVRAGAVLDGIEMFDASFFGLSPREAELMDPQHRLFLECAWETFENSGYDPETYDGRIGVYAGAAMNTYLVKNLVYTPEIMDSSFGDYFQLVIANDKDYLSTRVSYKLNLTGPSVNVISACSTSLLALQLACQGLLNHQCDMALAGGVSVKVTQEKGYLYQEGGVLSPDGHCRAFDADAKGTMLNASGMGSVLLKRLEDAIADGDCVHAVIRGVSVNNDGSEKVGFTAPGVKAQAEVIAEAHAVAETDPETISYVEAHGTGTLLGDPIEIAALTQAFRFRTQKKGFCAIGSVKTNIGHLDAATGMASLIKTVLALKHKRIPPSLNFERPNPRIDFANSPFYVNTELSEWEPGRMPRRAGVSSFGIGGTNVHVVLEEAPEDSRLPVEDRELKNTDNLQSGIFNPKSPIPRPWQLIVLSAKTVSALNTATVNLAEYLKQHPDLHLADVAYTLKKGRKAFSHRRILVCQDDINEAVAGLRSPAYMFTGTKIFAERPVVFMFSGQGAQYVNMGLGLYLTEPTFRSKADLCSELLKPHLGLDLRDLMYPDAEQADKAARKLDQTAFTQPALFVIEYALAKLWMEWGVRPQAMIGHSVGEYVAACIAGVFSLEDALALVAARGRLMGELPRGSMLAVPLSEKELQPLLKRFSHHGILSLAAVNAPGLCVVSGQAPAVEAFQNLMDEQGVACRGLHTSHGFHSEMMEPVLEPFIEQVRKTSLKSPKIPYISNVTGSWITDAEARDPEYWARHLRQTVLFSQGMQLLLNKPEQILLELGPGRTLSTFAIRHPDKMPEQAVLSSIRHPRDRKSDDAFLLMTLGKLWLGGVQIDWDGFYAYKQRYRVPLPTYPFECQRYWIEPGNWKLETGNWKLETGNWKRETGNGKRKTGDREQVSKKPDIADWFYIPSWKESPLPVSSFQFPVSTLVFADECGLGSQLAKQLEDQGQSVISVKPGTEFSRLDNGTYTLDPEQADHYNVLLGELRELGRIPKQIVHLWGVTGDPGSEESLTSEIKRLDKTCNMGFYSLLFLVQAIGKQGVTEELEIAVVSDNVQTVTGDEKFLCPGKATVLGPVKVIPKEYPNISCCSIDVVIPEKQEAADIQKLADQLLAELMTESSEPVIAYRGNARWVQTFEPVPLESENRLREKGVWLITGGLGGIGLVLAEYLAKTTQARLVLTGRSALPDKNEWEEWLSGHGEEDGASRKIRKIRELEELGAEVIVAAADVANPKQMQEAVTEAEEYFGPINGIIHAAGVPGGGVIQLKTREMAEGILSPKLRGTLVLDNIFRDVRQPDFFMLCSSIASVTGGFGQADYCAANAFLDAFAYLKTSRDNIFTVSVNWDTWQEVGMAAASAKQFSNSQYNAESQSLEKAHPLFDSRMTGPDQEIYITRFNPGRHWVLDDHRSMGKAILPGTAYLEMALAAFEYSSLPGEQEEIGTIEMRDVYFLVPLMVEEDEDKEVRLILEKKGDHFEFSVISESKTQGEWVDHAKGKIARIETEFPREYEITEIESRCDREDIFLTISERKDREKLINYGARWDSLDVFLKSGENQGLAVLKMSEGFAGDFDLYKLHPALLDVATGCLFFVGNFSGLPFSYKSLKIKGPLPGKVFSHIISAGDQSRKGAITYNITIMDALGRELVDIEEYTMELADPGLAEMLKPSHMPESRNFNLKVGSPGLLETLTLQPGSRRNPGPDEIEIEVCATGLNFKEVLFALGMLPPEMHLELGMECAGKIVGVGENVEAFETGDEVIAFAPACFSVYTTTPAFLAAPKPDHISSEDAATIPVAFMTAYYGLVELGRLSRGERILIHAAAGGVGMAAVKIAQWKGAEIFATAGNSEKRAFLRSLGIKHVMDSRTLDFADEVMEQTDGRGVNVVLNSLAGEFIPKSFSVLAEFGRFLEIGVRDIYNDTPLGMRPFEKHLSFFAIGIRPELPGFSSIFRELIQHFDSGDLTPLPKRVFPITEAANAFEYMARAKHIGKIVVSLQDKAAATQKSTYKAEVSDSRSPISGFLEDGILPSEGAEVFRRILENKDRLPQMVISSCDLQTRIEQDETLLLAASGQAVLSEPTHPRPDLGTPYVAPRNEFEEAIADHWRRSLGIRKIGIYDDFFELGGDSLLASQLISRVRETFQVEVPINSLFENPTVSGLVEAIEQKKLGQEDPEEMARLLEKLPEEKMLLKKKTASNSVSQITPISSDQNFVPLSFAQERLWTLCQLEPGNSFYNLSWSLQFIGSLNVSILEQSFNEIRRRHEILRTTFTTKNKVPVQVIAPSSAMPLPIIDLQQLPEVSQSAEVRRLAVEEAQHPFDLTRGPLFQASLVRLNAEEHVLLLTIHHIIFDGWSIGIFIRELTTLYEALSKGENSPLPELSIQYADYASWQRKRLTDEELKKQLRFWKKQLAGVPPVSEFPSDRPRPVGRTFRRAASHFDISYDLTRQLRLMGQRSGATLFMSLLTAFATLLHRYSKQEDIILATPISNRNHKEVKSLIGFFSNPLLLRTDFSGKPSFTDLLERVRQVSLDAYAHQDMPFEKLLEALHPEQYLNYSPLCQMMFILQNASQMELELPSLTIRLMEMQTVATHFDLTLTLTETESGLTGSLEYCTALFDETTILRITKHFQALLKGIATNPEQQISKLPLTA